MNASEIVQLGAYAFAGGIAGLIPVGLGILVIRSPGSSGIPRLLAMPITPVRALVEGRMARVRGIVSAAQEFESPVTGQRALLYSLRAACGDASHYLLERQTNEISLDDGTGQVRVRSSGAGLALIEDWLMVNEFTVLAAPGQRILGPPNATALAWVNARIPSAPSLKHIEELRVGPGERISVVGRVRQDADGLYFETVGDEEITLLSDDVGALQARSTMSTAVGVGLALLGVAFWLGTLVFCVWFVLHAA